MKSCLKVFVPALGNIKYLPSNFLQNLKKATIEAKNKVEDSIRSLAVDTTTRNERLEICNQCEYLTITRQCSKCGCFVDGKTLLSSSKCPLKKW